jgi:hypothetical protein
LWAGVLGIATIAAVAYFVGTRAPRAAASDVTPLQLTTLSIIPASGPIDRLWDYVAHSTGLYFLVQEQSGLIEVVHTDFTGALLHRFTLQASSRRGGRIAISQAGILAVMLFTSRNSSNVWLYSTPGGVPIVMSAPENVLEIAFSGVDLFAASVDQIFRIAQNGNSTVPGSTSSLTSRLDWPFALLPLVDGKLGLVEFTTAQLHLASPQLANALPPALLGSDEVQKIPDAAAQNGAGKLYSATSDEAGHIYLGLPNFQPHRDVVLQLDANGAFVRRLKFAVEPTPSPDQHLHPIKLRVTGNKLFVSYTAYQDRVAYYQFQ